uniref:Fibrillar collagen NC1 domain-containing protein n=1 Tax=Syphacia muris TaxID=451379 RepID=A0A0N5APF4_9BILA
MGIFRTETEKQPKGIYRLIEALYQSSLTGPRRLHRVQHLCQTNERLVMYSMNCHASRGARANLLFPAYDLSGHWLRGTDGEQLFAASSNSRIVVRLLGAKLRVFIAVK